MSVFHLVLQKTESAIPIGAFDVVNRSTSQPHLEAKLRALTKEWDSSLILHWETPRSSSSLRTVSDQSCLLELPFKDLFKTIFQLDCKLEEHSLLLDKLHFKALFQSLPPSKCFTYTSLQTLLAMPLGAFTPEYFSQEQFRQFLGFCVHTKNIWNKNFFLQTFSPLFSPCQRAGTFLGRKRFQFMIGWANCKPRPVKL